MEWSHLKSGGIGVLFGIHCRFHFGYRHRTFCCSIVVNLPSAAWSHSAIPPTVFLLLLLLCYTFLLKQNCNSRLNPIMVFVNVFFYLGHRQQFHQIFSSSSEVQVHSIVVSATQGEWSSMCFLADFISLSLSIHRLPRNCSQHLRLYTWWVLRYSHRTSAVRFISSHCFPGFEWFGSF